MDQQLGTLAALPEDLGSVPSTHTAAYHHDYCPKGSNDLFWLLQKSNSTGVQHSHLFPVKVRVLQDEKPSWAARMRRNRIIFCYIDKEFHLLSSWEVILEVLCSSWCPSWLYLERPCDPGGLKTWCFVVVLKFYMRHTTICRTSFQEKINSNNKALLCR